MLLGEIRDYLQQHGTASVDAVATHFDIAPDTARFALDYWQRKGKIRQMATVCSSGGCGKNCGSTKAATIYEWVKRDIPLRWLTR
ncbi:MAG: DeoR family transcriptional regulator [Candidatus Thiothrix moscowensis]|nr:DeoR family transcriptional regulator [Candidatus Thiothrix moscowensis]